MCWAGCQSLTGSASQVHNTHSGTTKNTWRAKEGEKKVLSRKLHKTEDISFASVSICNLVQQAEYSILHRKNRMFPFMKSCEGGETFCHRKVGGDDLFRGVQMI